jgi:hypothetical protein
MTSSFPKNGNGAERKQKTSAQQARKSYLISAPRGSRIGASYYCANVCAAQPWVALRQRVAEARNNRRLNRHRMIFLEACAPREFSKELFFDAGAFVI